MTTRTVAHSTFTHERVYPAAPATVFRAWADPAVKAQWFGPGAAGSGYTSDFRIGGAEHLTVTLPDGRRFTYDAQYRDIVPAQRLVYWYEMSVDDERMSMSVATVQLTEVPDGTRLTATEQGAYLDGLDQPEFREQGVGEQLDALGKLLAG